MKRTKQKLSTLKLAIALALGAGSAAYGVSAYAADAQADIGATIITPIAITNTGALEFGSFSVNGTPGSVTVDTTGARTPTNVLLSSLGAAPSAATFTVSGDTTATYVITLPTDGTVTIGNGADDLSVNSFVSDPAGTGALTGGSQNLAVGATLEVDGTESTGTYAGTFDVTVEYN